MKHYKQRPPREVRIERFDARGGGEGDDSFGRRWSIRGAPVGATILAAGRSHDGTRLGLVHPAEDAVAPACPVFGVCGGCQWQEMPVARQREEKAKMLDRLLNELGGESHPIRYAGKAYGYRNKIELTFGVGRYLLAHELNTEIGRIGRWLGFHAPGRHDRIVDVETCALASNAINEVYVKIRGDVLASSFPFWDSERHVGFFRNLVLREGIGPAGEPTALAALYTSAPGEEETGWLRDRAGAWGASCVAWFVNPGPSDAAVGDLHEILADAGESATIFQALAGLRFRLSPTAFFQVNVAAAEVLVETVRELLGPNGGVLWDLYCGAGLLGLAFAPQFDRVVGIESVEAAVLDARRNAQENGIANVEFVAGPVEVLVGSLPPPEVIIVDPPRNGLHPDAVKVLAAVSAARSGVVLVYVACKPTSLLRDGKLLGAAGWVCTDRVAVDLFPQTAHVEVVTRWVSG